MKYIVILDPGVASREKPGTYPPYDNGINRDIFIKNSSNLPLEGKVYILKIFKAESIVFSSTFPEFITGSKKLGTFLELYS